jgi:hypothetical protein
MSVALTTTHENCYFRRSIPGFFKTPCAENPLLQLFLTEAGEE